MTNNMDPKQIRLSTQTRKKKLTDEEEASDLHDPDFFLSTNSIDVLNDDCLLNIFDYLPLQDRIRIERVCKRWERLSKESWRNVKFISIGSDFKTRSMELNHLKEILHRSGDYMTSFDCSWQDKCNLPAKESLELINKYCRKLTHLNTCYSFKSDKNYLNLLDVNIIKNLKSLNIGNFVYYDEHLSEMLEKAKNLEEFNLTGYDNKTNHLLPLSDKCKTLALTYSRTFSNAMLQEILATHPNIQNLDISGTRIYPYTLLPFTDRFICLALWQMDKFFGIDSSNFNQFKCPNLRVLDLRFNDFCLSGETLTVLIENCPNIEDLRLERSRIIKQEHFQNLTKLKKLMYLDVSFTNISDNSLIAVSEANGKLKKLECYGCDYIRTIGLSKVISALPELTYLSISTSKLNKLLIDHALASLKERQNKEPLTICLSSKNINNIVNKVPNLIKQLKLNEKGVYDYSQNNFLRIVFGTSKCDCNFDKTCFCLSGLETLAHFG